LVIEGSSDEKEPAVTEETPLDPLPGDGPPQAVPPAAGALVSSSMEPPTVPPPAEVASTSQERTFAMLCHLSALSALIGIPFGNIIGPLIFWLVKRDEFPLVDDQGKESLNFQISITIYAVVSAILVLLVIGIALLIALGIFWLVMVIVASVKANEGQAYRYPITIRFLN
jgi:uncharacterized protein